MDVEILRLLNGLASRAPGWDHVVAAIATYGPLLLVAALAVRSQPWRSGRPGRIQVVQAMAASLLGLAAAQLIGHVYFRPRPFAAVPGLHLLLGRSPEASFPSEHVVVSAALAYFVGNGSLKWAAAAWTLVAVIGAGRVYAATHYPSDILGGIALGTVSAWFSRWFSTRIITRARRAQRPSW